MTGKNITNVDRARRAWGKDIPKYVQLLAQAADRLGQRGAGALIDYTSSSVSRIINRSYNASYDEVEKLVLAALGNDEVDCPLFGKIPFSSCVRNRRRTGPPVNFLQRQFAEHCPVCPLNTDVSQSEDVQ